jgi:hypothetical protein
VQKENGRYMNVEDFIRKFVDVAYFWISSIKLWAFENW